MYNSSSSVIAVIVQTGDCMWWLCLSLLSMTVRPCIWPCSCWHNFLPLVDYVFFFFIFFFMFIKQRVTLTFKVLPCRHGTHTHARWHMCCPRGEDSCAPRFLCHAWRTCTWATKLQIMVTEDSGKITAAVHIYCFDITVPLMQHPQGLDCILPSRGLKNLQFFFEAETAAWNSMISVSRAGTRTWGCQALQQNQNLLGEDIL